MNRTASIANLKTQIAVNSQFAHTADMVAKQRVKLARWEQMTDAQFDAEQAAARNASVHSMARSLRR